MRHPKLTGIALASALALTLASCSGDADGGGGGDDLAQVQIGLAGTPPIFLSTVMQVAQEQGYFTEEGVEVTLRPFASGADVVRAVQSGELDGGMTVTEAAASVRASGGSVVGVMGFPDSSFTLVSTNPDVTTCEDMVDATFAADVPGTPLYIAAQKMLGSCGLTPEDLTSVTVNGTVQVDALINGQADAAVLHPEQIALAAKSLDVTTVTSVPEVDPDSHYMLLITRDEELADEAARATWVDVVRATTRAVDYMYAEANLGSVAAAAAEITTRDAEVVESALPTYLGMDFWPEGYDGLPLDRIQATIQRQVDIGNIPAAGAPTAEELVDPSVYADAAGE